MDCSIFQDRITDYLDGELEGCAKAEFAAHRLRCRDCRQTFADVRETVEALNSYAQRDEVPSLENLEARILDATSAGEMLSCGDFDRLIEKFFDGVILGPTFQTFQAHFEQCVKCRRLMRGIEEAIELCHEAKEEVEVPASLTHRILAATTGAPEVTTSARWRAKAVNAARAVWTPQWAAAALIFAAGGLFISARFGSLDNMADKAGEQAGRLVAGGQQAINQTEVMAASGMQLLAGGFVSVRNSEPKRAGTRPAPARTPQPALQPTPANDQPNK
jgi:predicted anti-sigma-YlaC factor YlaD